MPALSLKERFAYFSVTRIEVRTQRIPRVVVAHSHLLHGCMECRQVGQIAQTKEVEARPRRHQQVVFGVRHQAALDKSVERTVAGRAANELDTRPRDRLFVGHDGQHFQCRRRLASPTSSSLVRPVHAGIRRTIGTAQVGKTPTLVADLKLMLEKLPATRVGLRDRAVLLLGFAGAFRRSEPVSLDINDLDFSRAGLIVTLRKSKADQEGKSQRLGIPFGSSESTCPVRAVQAWLESARITDGPVLRPLDRFQRVQPARLSAERIALIVKRRAKAVGLDPARYAGHSLRAGLATSAAAAGASERVIMSQTGHRSADMVRRYIREGSLFTSNPAAMVGL